MFPTKFLLVDDHALFRYGLRMMLSEHVAPLDIQEAASVEEAIHNHRDTPAVLLLDIHLQGLNGLEGIALIKRRWPQVIIIILSSQTEPETVQLAMERGATAFVSKGDSMPNMLISINNALTQPSPATAKRVDTLSNKLASSLPRLTPRQCEVLAQLCQGLSNKLIARRLEMSENTVRGHVQAVLAALKVSSRSEAAFVARRSGLIGCDAA